MSDDNPAHHQVVPIATVDEVIGAGTIVGPGLVLTALHVIDPEPIRALRVAGSHRVVATASLPLRHYGPERGIADLSYYRDRRLVGDDLGTVDIALLAVRGLDGPGLPVRGSQVSDGELISVPSYRAGRTTVTTGMVLSHDDADFVARVVLRPGDSGAPAIDSAGRLAGLAALDLGEGRAIFVGPQLLATAIERMAPLLVRIIGDE